MTEDAPPSSDRRRAPRHVSCFPSFVEHSSERITAMIADLAETGTRLFLLQPDFEVGEKVRLELHILLDDERARTVNGHVVRVEPLPTERASLWTHEVAIEFDETMPLTVEEVDALEKREAPFGKHTT